MSATDAELAGLAVALLATREGHELLARLAALLGLLLFILITVADPGP
jgi:hypothetical protein